jgi:DUF1680 family protein
MLNALTGQYFQMHTPIRKQTAPVGHSVRFGYLETTGAMLQRLTGDWAKFFAIAETLGTNYHDLAVYVLLDFMARWDKGERPPTETKTVLKRP